MTNDDVPELPAYPRNPKLRLRRPENGGDAPDQTNAFGGRAMFYAKHEVCKGRRMMKVALLVILFAGFAYAAIGVMACHLLSAKISESEKRQAGIGAAIACIARDQLKVSERMRDITTQTLERGGSKLDEVAMMLGDPELNRLALTYVGSDWAIQRSEFLGNIKHSRGMLKAQKESRANLTSRLNAKIKELELRKRSLRHQMKMTPCSSAERSWQIEFDDIERQLLAYRSSNTYREYVEKDAVEVNQIDASAKNENNLFKLAGDCQALTIGALNKVMAEKLASLREEEAEPSRLRLRMSYFNVWPLNLVCKMPIGD